MFESMGRPVVAATLASALSALALSACTSNSTHTPSVPRCYEAPQASEYTPPASQEPPAATLPPEQFDKALKQWEASLDPWQLSPLRLPVRNGLTAGDPIYSEAIVDRVKQSLVEISTRSWKGTGFLTADAKGEQVVVTAAHVVDDAKLGSLKIETDDGQITHPTGGCYIYENKGSFVKLQSSDETRPVDTDIAVLTLAQPFHNPDLAVARQEASRGEWTFFENYQADHEPSYPAFYSGMVASTSHDPQGFSIVTGAEKLALPITQREIDDSQIQPGASGGPIVDQQGDVIGISTAGDKANVYEDAGMLQTLYSVEFPGAPYGPDGGFVPNVAHAMSAHLIRMALAAPAA